MQYVTASTPPCSNNTSLYEYGLHPSVLSFSPHARHDRVMAHAAREVATFQARALEDWDPTSSIPSLIGSLLSATATFSVILLWIFASGRKRKDFRYALILNLTVAGTYRAEVTISTGIEASNLWVVVNSNLNHSADSFNQSS